MQEDGLECVFFYLVSFEQNITSIIFQKLYEKSLHIKSAIPHPLIMGVIRGKSKVSKFYR